MPEVFSEIVHHAVSLRKGNRRFRKNLGIRGDQSNLSGRKDTDERFPVDAEIGGINDIITCDLVAAVSGDLREICDESEKKAN